MDPLATSLKGSMPKEAWAGLDIPGPEHWTLTSEDIDVQDLSEPDNLVQL
jgi:hypothetical protein